MRAPVLSSLTLSRSLASVAALASVALAIACASSQGARSPGAAAREDDTSTSPTLADVERLEIERAAPRALAPALSADAADDVRARAALTLARLEHVDAAPLLFLAAKDESAAVRRHAAFGLGQLDLALVDKRELHDEMRRGIEAFLVSWHGREQSAGVSVAIVRALGRVSSGEGITYLLRLAGEGPARAEALYALGVAGARRSSSLSADARLLAAVVAALADNDEEVRRAAAYAAFRQKLPLPPLVLSRAAKEPDAATRIHLARAMNETLSEPSFAVPLASDRDWRVQVEAIRALGAQAARGGALPVDVLQATGEAAAKKLVAQEGVGAEGHVVGAVCDALSNPALPATSDVLRPAVEALASVLSSSSAAALDAVRCRCAVALDALASRTEAVHACAPTWSPSRVRRLEVQVATKARLSSRERSPWLAKALADGDVSVRVQAAWALVDDGSNHAAHVAASRLEQEEDAAVAGALLSLFAGPKGSELSDVTLARVVDRFYAARTLEEAEPLLQAAALLEGRLSVTARDAAERLRAHPEPRLGEIVDGVPHGERAHGPRAVVKAPKAVGDLPLAAILKTSRGDIHIAFEREAAPVAVDNFVTLARRGFYDGVVFHRVVSDFVAQGGDPRGDGSGGPGHHIPCENTDDRYERGAIGMALAGKDTGGSQFFLTHSEQPHLDGRYTIFARVTSGLSAMDALMPDDPILSVEFAGAVPAREAAR